MAITPGQGGSPFDPVVLDRIQRLRERGHKPTIGVDGGVTTQHFAPLHAAGATWVISGTGLFASTDISQWLAQCQASFTRDEEDIGRPRPTGATPGGQ